MNPKKDQKTQADYERQQEDIRANQIYGESSLDRGPDRQHHTDRPQNTEKEDTKTEEDLISPKKERGYDISPTATNVKI